ncbi:MAG: hypothetical protein COB67_11895 [SAR324 cluster bacterium]|uniref:Outer membrane protein beta-barrel domain-containing protein n=1 Tax=SAR324 cluster bacterium TaxID=2024889 RepID=A0A2A4SSU2_9DELT|nr:MAG: hypothetical protein COB67_11895 [SAR324 cluster bacterium]
MRSQAIRILGIILFCSLFPASSYGRSYFYYDDGTDTIIGLGSGNYQFSDSESDNLRQTPSTLSYDDELKSIDSYHLFVEGYEASSLAFGLQLISATGKRTFVEDWNLTKSDAYSYRKEQEISIQHILASVNLIIGSRRMHIGFMAGFGFSKYSFKETTTVIATKSNEQYRLGYEFQENGETTGRFTSMNGAYIGITFTEDIGLRTGYYDIKTKFPDLQIRKLDSDGRVVSTKDFAVDASGSIMYITLTKLF